MTRMFLALIASLLLLPAGARAADRIVDVSSVETVAGLVREAGYKAEIKTAEDGSKYILSASNGNEFQLYFYGCKDGSGCDSFEFYSWYKKEPFFTAELANEWNAKKRFLKIAVDKDGDLAEYIYVSAFGKMTYANFVDYIEWFTSMDSELGKFLREKQDAAKAKGG